MASATIVSPSTSLLSRRLAASERGFFLYGGRFAFPTTDTTTTITLDQTPRTVFAMVATYGAAAAAANGPLGCTISGNVVTVSRVANTTYAIGFDLMVMYE